jgi:hypothetical protein
MAADVMAGVADARDQGGMPLGHPADDEAGGADTAAVEQIERALRVVDHPRLERVPRRRLRDRRHAADVEPFLDIDGERVDHAPSPLAGRGSTTAG